MRVLIVSDTHGHEENLERILTEKGPFQHLIHLGDVEGQEDYIEVIAGCPVHIVAGNNDFFSDLPREEDFWIKNYHIFITHGHYYGVSLGPEGIIGEGRDRGVDIVMFGHTHQPYLHYVKDLTVLNPGSLSFPRQDGRRPSYIMMEIDRDGEAHYTVNYL